MLKIILVLAFYLFLPLQLFSEEGNRLTEISAKIEGLKSSQIRIEKEIRNNNEDARKISTELLRLEGEISQLNSRKKELAETSATLTEQISDTEERIVELREDSNKRLKAFYISPVRAGLVNAPVETDLNSASRYNLYFKKLRAYEFKVLNELQRLNNNLASQKEALASGQSEMDIASDRLSKNKEQLLENQNKQSKLVSELKRQKSENARLVSQLRAEFLRIETAIASLSAVESVAAVSSEDSVIKAAGETASVQSSDSLLATRFPAPLAGKPVSRFGSKTEDTLGQKSNSKGLGFAAAEGTEVQSVGAGKVAFAGILGDYGQVVIIDHGGRIHTLYSMLESSELKAGQQVQPGSTIGRLGKIISPKPYNLYFELRVAGQAQNPEPRMDWK